MTARTAILGLGAIGAPIAARLMSRGLDVVGFDPDEERSGAYAAHGAVAPTAAAAAATADVIAVLVADATQAETALFGPDGAVEGARPGTAVVLMSTLGIDAARRIQARLESYGLPVLDAAITGGVVRAAAGEVVLMAGGDAAVLERLLPLLECVSADVVHCGPRVGDGQAMKMANQLLCSVHIVATTEALALAAALGLDPTLVVRTLSQGAAQSFVFDDHAERIIQHDSSLLAAIGLIAKDIDLVVAEAAKRELSVTLARCAQQIYADAVAHGYARADTTRMIELAELRQPAAEVAPGG